MDIHEGEIRIGAAGRLVVPDINAVTRRNHVGIEVEIESNQPDAELEIKLSQGELLQTLIRDITRVLTITLLYGAGYGNTG